ncbi:phosphatidylethanolamine-binding protein [Cubamyces lactineus]|nr:phosphatidylethanolamine-binding protein [Cubamyces lactineus]
MLVQVLLAAAFAASVTAQNSTNVTVADVAQAFTTAKLVPDVLPAFKPTAILNVVFLDNTTGVSVNVTPGMNLTREQTALRPQFFLNATAAQIRHLLAPGIMANGSLATGAALVNNTPAISDFLRPTPPAGSDPHRYTLLLFIQPSNFTTAVSSFVNSTTPVNNFNISLFAQELGLGSPIAGNFFLTGPDANSTNSTGTNSTSNGTSTGSSPTSTNPSASLGNGDSVFAAAALATVMFGLSLVSLI